MLRLLLCNLCHRPQFHPIHLCRLGAVAWQTDSCLWLVANSINASPIPNDPYALRLRQRHGNTVYSWKSCPSLQRIMIENTNKQPKHRSPKHACTHQKTNAKPWKSLQSQDTIIHQHHIDVRYSKHWPWNTLATHELLVGPHCTAFVWINRNGRSSCAPEIHLERVWPFLEASLWTGWNFEYHKSTFRNLNSLAPPRKGHRSPVGTPPWLKGSQKVKRSIRWWQVKKRLKNPIWSSRICRASPFQHPSQASWLLVLWV